MCGRIGLDINGKAATLDLKGRMMPIEGPLIKGVFYVSGTDFNPDDFTQCIGLIPTETTNSGTIKNWKTEIPVHWEISREKRCFNIDEIISEVLEHIWNSRNKIVEYVSDNNLEISVICNVHIENEKPIYELGISTLKRLSQFGASFIMDIFDYRA